MKVFIAGAIKIDVLKTEVLKKLDGVIEKNIEVLIGDAAGVDSLIQKYLKYKKYKNVKVYSTNGKVRNNFGSWEVESVLAQKEIKGRDFYTVKDIKMAKDADIGFMIWNGESQGTLNNMINLLSFNKKVCLFLNTENKIYILKELEELKKIIFKLNNTTIKKKFEKLEKIRKEKKEYERIRIEKESPSQIRLI